MYVAPHILFPNALTIFLMCLVRSYNDQVFDTTGSHCLHADAGLTAIVKMSSLCLLGLHCMYFSNLLPHLILPCGFTKSVGEGVLKGIPSPPQSGAVNLYQRVLPSWGLAPLLMVCPLVWTQQFLLHHKKPSWKLRLGCGHPSPVDCGDGFFPFRCHGREEMVPPPHTSIFSLCLAQLTQVSSHRQAFQLAFQDPSACCSYFGGWSWWCQSA